MCVCWLVCMTTGSSYSAFCGVLWQSESSLLSSWSVQIWLHRSMGATLGKGGGAKSRSGTSNQLQDGSLGQSQGQGKCVGVCVWKYAGFVCVCVCVCAPSRYICVFGGGGGVCWCANRKCFFLECYLMNSFFVIPIYLICCLEHL